MEATTVPGIKLTKEEMEALLEAQSILNRIYDLYNDEDLKRSNYPLYWHLRMINSTFNDFMKSHSRNLEGFFIFV